jgi:ABC-type transport system involved in multi-copper enzyme maturation permease subunit
VISLFLWALLVFVIPNLGNILAGQFVKTPSVQQLEVKRQHIWIKEVFDIINNGKDRQDALDNISSENDKLAADYRTDFNKLVTVSMNITRFSPAAALTFLTTDLLGTGITEERRLKNSILQYKNQIYNRPSDSDGNITGEIPVFTFKRSNISTLLTIKNLGNLFVLILFNILFFTASYVVFLRYDVR